MRVAAIGVSHWHSLYDSAYLVHLAGIPGTELVAIQDESASITAKRAAALGNPAVYTDYRKMLAETRPEVLGERAMTLQDDAAEHRVHHARVRRNDVGGRWSVRTEDPLGAVQMGLIWQLTGDEK